MRERRYAHADTSTRARRFDKNSIMWYNKPTTRFPPKCQSTRIIPDKKNKPYKISSEVTSSKCMMIFNDINSCNIFQRYCQDNQYPPLRANNRSGPQEMPCPALSGANFNPTVTVPRQQTKRRTQQKIYENIWRYMTTYENIWKYMKISHFFSESFYILSYWEKIFYPSPSPLQ